MNYKTMASQGMFDKSAILNQVLGKSIDDVKTPALIIDRKIFADNCAMMHKKAKEWGATFRAHLKTHKTSEGTKLQLVTSEGQTHAVVVSTLREAWAVVNTKLVAEGIVKDILYGLPVSKNKIADLAELWDEVQSSGGIVRLLVDHPEQVRFLEEFQSQRENPRRWSVFIKINGGQNRAGLSVTSSEFSELLALLLDSPAISLHGFYGHAGNSYASTSLVDASSYLSSEVEMVDTAARLALAKLATCSRKENHSQPFVLSVGSTPTAHAAGTEARTIIKRELHGILELHAGNYPMLDLQQEHTGLIDQGRISQRVRATVVSYYPGRGEDGHDEALIDAGAIAFSKDGGPSGGYGKVIGKPWILSRISQEHGILTCPEKLTEEGMLEIGSFVDIVGQHACLIAAAHPWYYIVDSDVNGGADIVDIWVPWKGW